jgi:hypothetical protein
MARPAGARPLELRHGPSYQLAPRSTGPHGRRSCLAGRPQLSQTNVAIERLLAAEILTQVTVGRRNRAFEAQEIINAFTDLERQLASPDGDTLTSEVARPVPPKTIPNLGLRGKPK